MNHSTFTHFPILLCKVYLINNLIIYKMYAKATIEMNINYINVALKLKFEK